MTTRTLIAAALIVGGTLALVYGGFTYVSDTHDVDLGVAEVSIVDKDNVDVPVWAGVASIVIGTGVLLAGRRG